MNNFFKMSLVAAAIAVTGTATAGTFTGVKNAAGTVVSNENVLIYSTEGVTKGVAASQVGPVVSYKLGAAYIVGDELTLTLGTYDGTKSVFPATIMVDTGEFNLISKTATNVVYRVVAGKANVGSVFTLPQTKVTTADLTDASKSGLVYDSANLIGLTLDASATTNNGATPHDANTSVANANLVYLSASQFGTAKVATKFNAVVDDSTAGASKKFVSGTNDSFSYTYTAPTVVPTIAVLGKNDGVNDFSSAANSVAPVMTIAATLPIADIAKYTITSAAGTVTTAANGTTAANADITVTYPTGTTVPNDTLTITPKTGTSAPSMGAYTFDAAIASNGATVLATGASNAGAWAVTGSDTVEIPYMPYGTGLSQVIYATNKSVSDVEVSAKGTDEAGTVYDLGVIGIANASSVTKLSTDLKNGFAAKGFTDGKLAIVLTFRGNNADVTTGTIQVQSGYNANASDRGFVSNTSNGSK
nr:49 kDa protein [Shewanella sp.]